MTHATRRQLALRLAGCAAALLLVLAAAAPAGAAAKKLILFVSNDTALASEIARNAAHVDALPFDGVAITSPASWAVMRPGARLDYTTTYQQLAPIKGRLTRVKHNFLQTYVDAAADPFDDWSAVIQNWVILARAAKDAGLVGILFDNEEYKGRLWRYPDNVRYPWRTRLDYQLQHRRRGRQVMEAIRAVWPTVKFIHLHGPYISEQRTPGSVSLLQIEQRDDDLRGHFFVGMLVGSTATARVIDGGEVYQYRTPEDFSRSYNFRKHDLPKLSPNHLVPPWITGLWPNRTSVAFGVYDMAWKEGYPMTPAILAQTIRYALAQADEYVWLFTEWSGPNQYLRPGGVAPSWINAVRAGRAVTAGAATQ